MFYLLRINFVVIGSIIICIMLVIIFFISIGNFFLIRSNDRRGVINVVVVVDNDVITMFKGVI